MKIRDADPTDEPILLEFIAAIQDAECAIHPSRLPGEQVAAGYLRKLLDHRASILLGEEEGRAIGFVAGWPELDDDALQKLEWRRHGRVSDLYVVPDHRGKGLAQQLLQAMSLKLRERGVKRLRICALATNLPTMAAYRRFGFEPFEVDFDKPLAG
jgi:GNAT superfamily N-acetyltransferase